MNKKLLAVLNVVFFIATVAVNALANILPINGVNTGELSDFYPNLFVPAGITFSIWGLIYTLLLIFSIYGLVVVFKKGAKDSIFVEKIGYLFIASSIFNIGWILAWHYKLTSLSLVIMLLILISLSLIYIKLGIGTEKVENPEKYVVHVPFSVYLGWISIATIANATAVLVNLKWNGFSISQVFWTILMIVIGTGLTLIMLGRKNDIYFSLVVLWAFAGIIIKRMAVGGADSRSIIISVIICMGIMVIALIPKIKKYN